MSPYSLDVAHWMNSNAACFWRELAGTARAQVHSQELPLSVTARGALTKPTLSGTRLWVLSVTKAPATLASTHMAHLPALKSVRFSLKPLLLGPGGPKVDSRST